MPVKLPPHSGPDCRLRSVGRSAGRAGAMTGRQRYGCRHGRYGRRRRRRAAPAAVRPVVVGAGAGGRRHRRRQQHAMTAQLKPRAEWTVPTPAAAGQLRRLRQPSVGCRRRLSAALRVVADGDGIAHRRRAAHGIQSGWRQSVMPFTPCAPPPTGGNQQTIVYGCQLPAAQQYSTNTAMRRRHLTAWNSLICRSLRQLTPPPPPRRYRRQQRQTVAPPPRAAAAPPPPRAQPPRTASVRRRTVVRNRAVGAGRRRRRRPPPPELRHYGNANVAAK